MANGYIYQKHEESITVSNTGFKFGALDVQRVCTLPEGAVAIRLETQKTALNIRVTKGGRMYITKDGGEAGVISQDPVTIEPRTERVWMRE